MTTQTTMWEGGRGALAQRSQRSRLTAPLILIANARLESRPTVRKQSVRLKSNRKRIVIFQFTPQFSRSLLATNHSSLATSVLIYGSAIRNTRKPLKTQLDDYLRSTVKGGTRGGTRRDTNRDARPPLRRLSTSGAGEPHYINDRRQPRTNQDQGPGLIVSVSPTVWLMLPLLPVRLRV